MDTSQMSPIKLRTSDGQSFTIDFEIAMYSKTIKNMLANDLNPDGLEYITLSCVKADNFRKILEWLTHHKDDLQNDLTTEEHDDFTNSQIICYDESEWDKKFINELSPVNLISIMLASVDLGIKPLLNTLCKQFAVMIRNKTVEEIRTMFNVHPPHERSQETEQLASDFTKIVGLFSTGTKE